MLCGGVLTDGLVAQAPVDLLEGVYRAAGEGVGRCSRCGGAVWAGQLGFCADCAGTKLSPYWYKVVGAEGLGKASALRYSLAGACWMQARSRRLATGSAAP